MYVKIILHHFFKLQSFYIPIKHFEEFHFLNLKNEKKQQNMLRHTVKNGQLFYSTGHNVPSKR